MSVYTREKAEEQQECAKSRCLVVDGLKGSELPRTMIEKMGVASTLIFLDMNNGSQATANFGLDAILQTCQRNSALDCVVAVGFPTQPFQLRSAPKSLGGLGPMGGLPHSLFAKRTSRTSSASCSSFSELLQEARDTSLLLIL